MIWYQRNLLYEQNNTNTLIYLINKLSWIVYELTHVTYLKENFMSSFDIMELPKKCSL